MPTPSSASRLASQCCRIAEARPSGTHAVPTRVMPPLVTTRARLPRSACPTSRSLSPGRSPCARGIEDGDAGRQGGRDRRLQQRRLETHAAQADPQLFPAQPARHAPMVGEPPAITR
jgi:hypothetical protein